MTSQQTTQDELYNELLMAMRSHARYDAVLCGPVDDEKLEEYAESTMETAMCDYGDPGELACGFLKTAYKVAYERHIGDRRS